MNLVFCQSPVNKLKYKGKVRQQIKAWLKSGVIDNNTFLETEEGTPQGGVISPLLKERLNAKQSCLSYAGLTKELTQWKKEEDLFFLKQVHSQALQQSLNITISKRGKHWFVSIQVEIDREIPRHPSDSIVGGDLGIARFLTLSNQEYYEPISIFKKLKAKLAKLQKKLAKKEKFSNRWRRLKSKITKLHIRIADTRKDYLHKISSELSKNHAVVILEDLKITNMSSSAKGTVENPGKNVKQKSGLNRAILAQGWGEFIRQLEYKLTWHGGQLIQVNPKNTSRKCPKCNYISAENRKTQAVFCCQQNNCNYTANADYVGSLNVREAGLALLGLGRGRLLGSPQGLVNPVGSSLEHPLKSQPTDGA